MKPICIDCERDKPCVRCGREEYDLSKVTEYGPVCSSCYFYFKDPEQCQMCGKNSRRLSTYTHLDHDSKVCLKCMREPYGTCKACRRYRLLYRDKTGDLLCKKCLLVGEKLCEKCGDLMPAGYGKSCEDCYWNELLKKRINTGIQSLNHGQMKERFRSFGYWLSEKNGAKQSAIKINKLLPFFHVIDEKWKDVPEFKELVDHFGANKMRHFRLPMRWFNEKLDMVIDEEYKLEVTELSRIDKCLTSIDMLNPMLEAYINYQNHLLGRFKDKKIGLRTVRLTLSAVESLIRPVGSDNEFTQEYLDKHMISKPGQKAGLTGFINHLNEFLNTDFVLRVNEKKAGEHLRKKLKGKLIELLNDSRSDDQARKWLLYGLQYFHYLPMRIAGTALKNGLIVENDEGHTLTWKGKEYFIPSMEIISSQEL